MKKFLFILRRPPYEGSAARETLDMLMTIAAFDQPVRVLFLDDGVFLLKTGQCPEGLGLKPIQLWLAALQVYDVEELWVEEESLTERGLDRQNLSLPVQFLRRAEVARLVSEADLVVSG
jgi:tRNA 2-thiouridine synthesizing protein C